MSSSGYGRRKHPGTEGGYGGGKRSWSDVGGECNPYPHSNEDTFEKEKEKRKKNKKNNGRGKTKSGGPKRFRQVVGSCQSNGIIKISSSKSL